MILDVGSIPTASTMRERHGFDRISGLRFHAGIDAHRNENQKTTATENGDSMKRGKVLAFPSRDVAELQMAA